MLPQDKLDLILRRHTELSERLSQNVSGEQFVAMSRELSELEDVAAAIRERPKAKGRRKLGDSCPTSSRQPTGRRA